MPRRQCSTPSQNAGPPKPRIRTMSRGLERRPPVRRGTSFLPPCAGVETGAPVEGSPGGYRRIFATAEQQYPTPNIEQGARQCPIGSWMLNVRCWMVFSCSVPAAPGWGGAPYLAVPGEAFFVLRMHWDQEPTPNPSQEGN